MRRYTWLVLGAWGVLAGAVALYVFLGWQRYEGTINALEVDWRAPDAYLDTVSLSALPRALVRSPVLRELLTEDFVFYYDDHEERLSLRGALKRIAFEHDTTLADDLIELALDQPAEAVLWTDAKNAPRHWALAMTRGVVARALQGLATVATKDRQLTRIAELRAGFGRVPVYALTLSSRRTLALAARGDRLVVLSDPGLLFDADRRADPNAARVVAALLEGGGSSPLRQAFGLAAPTRGHTLVAGARLLAFGYQHFFPSLQALRFDLTADASAWQTHLRLAPGSAPASDGGLWAAVPVDPAACARLPLDPARLKAVLAGAARAAGAASAADAVPAGPPAAAAALADTLAGPAAVCWYAQGRLHTPLLVAQARAGANADPAAVEALLRWALPATAALAAPGADRARWQAEVEAPYAARGDAPAAADAPPEGEADGEGDAAPPAYPVTLARRADAWLFSPDGALVDAAIATGERRLPGVADRLPGDAPTLAVVSPERIAALVRAEAQSVLGDAGGAFAQAARQQLYPRLETFARLPPARAIAAAAADRDGWVPVQWQPLR